MDKNEVIFYTDGGCSGNPGPGGFGVVEFDNDKILYTYSEYCDNTTNNREELKAILHALKIAEGGANRRPYIIYSDSAYCVNICNDWIWTWAAKGWVRSKGKKIENLDLIQEIYNIINFADFEYEIKKCKGHQGMIGNELADALATNNISKFNKIIKDNNIEKI